MERNDILELMSTLKLYGMRAAYDEVMTTGMKRRHETPRMVGDLLSAEIAEKQARSIKYQLTIAKLPLAKDIDDFDFTGTPINEALVRELASGAFLAEQRNAVLIGGTGTGKSHLAIAVARASIRGGARGRFYTVVDLVNRLESEARGSALVEPTDQIKEQLSTGLGEWEIAELIEHDKVETGQVIGEPPLPAGVSPRTRAAR
jgi:DNA replication protein DnaC